MKTFQAIAIEPQVTFFERIFDAEVFSTMKNVPVFEPDEKKLSELSLAQLVEIYDTFARELNEKEVERFSTRQAGVRRVLAIINRTWEAGKGKRVQRSTKKDLVGTKKVAQTKSRKTFTPNGIGTINLKPKSTLAPARVGSKRAILIDCLAIKGGATMNQLQMVLSQSKQPWPPVSIKAGLTWDVNHEKGYGIKTEYQNGYERWCNGDRVTPCKFHAPVEQASELTEEERSKILDQAIVDGYQPDDDIQAVYRLVLPAGYTRILPHTPLRSSKK